MKWLDSGEAGPCNATEGDPKNIRLVEPQPEVTFSNIRWGEIDSTYGPARGGKSKGKGKCRRSLAIDA
jgi:cellulase